MGQIEQAVLPMHHGRLFTKNESIPDKLLQHQTDKFTLNATCESVRDPLFLEPYQIHSRNHFFMQLLAHVDAILVQSAVEACTKILQLAIITERSPFTVDAHLVGQSI